MKEIWSYSRNGYKTFYSDNKLNMQSSIRDRLQIFVSNSYREFVALYDIDTIFYKPHTN